MTIDSRPPAAQLALDLDVPAALPVLADRAGVEGPGPALGPGSAPDVLIPCELPGGPRPCLHRPLLAPRRRRPRSVLRPRHHAAPGLCRGPDRRRQRSQPARPPPDRVEGRAGHRGGGSDPSRGAPARLGHDVGELVDPGSRRSGRPETRRRSASRPPAALPPRLASRRFRRRSRSHSIHGPSPSSSTSGPSFVWTSGPTASSPLP